jgi:hypothetical protein
MALGNFIQTVWSANIMENLKKAHVFAGVANTDYQGQLKNLNDKVKVMQVSDVTITAFVRNTDLTVQDMDDAAEELSVDQPYYFNFKVEDVEAVQVKPQLLQKTTANAAYGFRDTVDQYFAGLYGSASLTSYATGTTNWDVTSLNVEDVLLSAGETMSDNKVPLEGRFLVVPPWFHTKLVLAGLVTKEQNDLLFANGQLQRVLGFDILLSNNVSASSTTTWASTRIIGGIRGQSLSFAEAILKIEAYRAEKRFTDGVKGLYVFGGKVMRPDMTICIYADKTAEA